MLQQGDAADVDKVRERGDGKEPEQKPVVLVFEHQNPVCLEIEQDAENSGQEIGNNVGVVEFEQIFEDEKEKIVYKQPHCGIQNGNQHKTYETRFKISV